MSNVLRTQHTKRKKARGVEIITLEKIKYRQRTEEMEIGRRNKKESKER
jgi:hypothetical protein